MTEQTLKPATAAKKLGVFLPATPEEFQNTPVTRSQLADMLVNPPEWLQKLRAEGPHPRQIVASKLGVSASGLVRGDMDKPLTTAEIKELLTAPPAWLVEERARQAAVRAEALRLKEAQAAKASKASHAN